MRFSFTIPSQEVKLWRVAVLFVCICGLCMLGIYLYPKYAYPVQNLELGMSPDEVLAVMGEPTAISDDDGKSTWYYWGDYDATIVFRDGRLDYAREECAKGHCVTQYGSL